MQTKRIAMWSGPRNLSTALMRSFASRRDCSVIDEPFYAAYLKATGIDHPMRNLILDSYNSNPSEIADNCFKGKTDKAIQYQKHMTHHMVPCFDYSFVHKVSNAFLIRSPEKVIKSFGKKITKFGIDDLGFSQQVNLFKTISDKLGKAPPVIDADELCANPKAVLISLCSSLGINFDDKMLSWNKGHHSYDGIWGSYWYKSVYKSTKFSPPTTSYEIGSDFEAQLIDEAEPYFQILNNYKIAF
jgi:hypothetical protein